MFLFLFLALLPGCPKGNPVVNITDYTTYRNGRDWAPAVVEALKRTDTLYFPTGEYYCSEVDVPDGKVLYGNGNKTIFHPLGKSLFRIEGKLCAEIPIEKDIDDFSNKIELTNIDSLDIGDDIVIIGQRNSILREGLDGVNYNSEYVLGRSRNRCCYYGEIDIVQNKSGSTITTANNRIFPDYFNNDLREAENNFSGKIPRKTTSVIKVEMAKNIRLSRFNVIVTPACISPIDIKYGKDCLVDSISFFVDKESENSKAGRKSLSIIKAYLSKNILVSNCSSEFSPKLIKKISRMEKSYANYSVYNLFKMISCWYCGFKNCSSNCATHGFSITYNFNSGISGIPSYKCFIDGCTSSGNIWSGITTQQGCYCTYLTNNKVTDSGQGVLTGGRNTLIKNNVVSTNLPFTTNYYYTHISFGGTAGIVLIEGYACGSVIESNTIKGFYTGILIRDGYEEKNIFEEGDISIANNSVSECVNGFKLKKNKFNTQPRNPSIKLKDNNFNDK